VVQAEEGYIFIRHEYPEQIAKVKDAVNKAKQQHMCGHKILNTGRRFDLEVVESPGGYICGEQSALLQVLQGERGQPRLENSAVDIQSAGLFGCPTVLNNVETFAWVPRILLGDGGFGGAPPEVAHSDDRGQWYAKSGRDGQPGRRLFPISGDVKRPGVYELPVGTPLGELIALSELVDDQDCAQGSNEKKPKPLKAVAPSGPSGGFLPAQIDREQVLRNISAAVEEARDKSEQDVLGRFRDWLTNGTSDRVDIGEFPLSLPIFRAIGTGLGAIIVYADGRNMIDEAANCVEFFRNESCGKCVPCRLGTQALVDFAGQLRRMQSQKEREAIRQRCEALGATMSETSICSLGKSAWKPLTSALDYFWTD
jgi:NADH:ubiquinone oxidoreductase subunit F (NADH-binding)